MTYIALALQLLPLLLKSILAVEDMLNTAPGSVKKSVILAALPADTSDASKVASSLIDSIVGVLNKTIWANNPAANPAVK